MGKWKAGHEQLVEEMEQLVKRNAVIGEERERSRFDIEAETFRTNLA